MSETNRPSSPVRGYPRSFTKSVTLKQLRIFERVATHTSHSRAAGDLHLTQPAVSLQIKELEGTLGGALFESRGRGIVLTEFGQAALAHARSVLATAQDFEDTVRGFALSERGTLRLGFISAGDYFVGELIKAFLQEVPGASFDLSISNRSGLAAALVERAVDIAIMGRPPVNPALSAQPFAPHPNVILAAPSHPLAKEKRIPLERVAQETFIVREPDSGPRLAFEAHFSRRGSVPKIGMEIRSNETIKQCVIAGLGLGFLSAHVVGLEERNGLLSVLDVEGFPVMRRWYIVTVEGRQLPPVAQRFQDFLRNHGERLIVASLQGKSPTLPAAATSVSKSAKKQAGKKAARSAS
ncbi:MAG TPA: LysR family transcriptional regulator [Burkholderiales bacterium]